MPGHSHSTLRAALRYGWEVGKLLGIRFFFRISLDVRVSVTLLALFQLPTSSSSIDGSTTIQHGYKDNLYCAIVAPLPVWGYTNPRGIDAFCLTSSGYALDTANVARRYIAPRNVRLQL